MNPGKGQEDEEISDEKVDRTRREIMINDAKGRILRKSVELSSGVKVSNAQNLMKEEKWYDIESERHGMGGIYGGKIP